MNIRCRFGFHKWTVFQKTYWKIWGSGQKVAVLHFGCLRCGKMKVKKGVPVNE